VGGKGEEKTWREARNGERMAIKKAKKSRADFN
jgi:hypothetical protein